MYVTAPGPTPLEGPLLIRIYGHAPRTPAHWVSVPHDRTDAYTLKKVVVPIKFDGTFTATGWLGALIGTKLFFNLGGLAEDQFNDKVHAVFTELQRVSHAQGLRASLPPGNHLSSAASAAAVVLATIRSAPKPTPVDHEVQSAVSTASTDLVGNDSARLAQLESEVRTAVSNAVNDIFAKARLAAPSSTAQ